MKQPEVRVFEDKNQLSLAGAELVCRSANSAAGERGAFTLLLAGGGTPRALYELLAGESFSGRMPWSATVLFWGDERFVPPEHPESNFRAARLAMIARAPLPPENVHPVPTADYPDAPSAALAYDSTLREYFRKSENTIKTSTGNFPRFDLVLLGMGADGHTASLFPGSSALREDSRLAVAVDAPRGYRTAERVSVTLPVLSGAATVLFMVTGSEKRPALSAVLGDPGQARRKYPAAMVRPHSGRLIWYLDREADVT